MNNKNYFAHESSIVDDGAVVGKGTKIWHFSHVMSGAKIGGNCNIGQNVLVGSGAVIGDNCKVQNNVSVYDRVILEDYVFCGPSMVFTNVINPRAHISRKKEFKQTLVRKGATLGANCTILCGNTIGEYAFVGAGAVVTRDVPPHALMLGNPAKISGWICECGVKLSFADGTATCGECGKNYEKIDETEIRRA